MKKSILYVRVKVKKLFQVTQEFNSAYHKEKIMKNMVEAAYSRQEVWEWRYFAARGPKGEPPSFVAEAEKKYEEQKKVAREIIPSLKRLGAEGIVEYPLNKLVP